MGATAMSVGTVLNAGGKIAGGLRQGTSLQETAGYLENEAGQAVASGIQGSIEARRRATYVASAAAARTAGAGMTTTGTSAVANEGLIRGEGEYRALTSLYQGYDRALELGVQASARRNEAGAAERAGWLSGITTVLSGGESFYSKYGSPFSAASYGGAVS